MKLVKNRVELETSFSNSRRNDVIYSTRLIITCRGVLIKSTRILPRVKRIKVVLPFSVWRMQRSVLGECKEDSADELGTVFEWSQVRCHAIWETIYRYGTVVGW
jgi:hypothetical protein